MDGPATNICSLPDELLLEILSSFNSIRSYEPQSTAFKNKKKERARQCSNLAKQSTLYSLCLTSRRLQWLATPLLYASFTGSATLHGLLPLQLFYRTICSNQPGVDPGLRFTAYLKYVENRLSDHQGNSFYHDITKEGAIEEGADKMIQLYYRLLAAVVNTAQNLEHLCLVSLETEDVSFWNYVLPSFTPCEPSSPLIATHGFHKLQSICFQIHTEGHDYGLHTTWFHRICWALTHVPLLTDFRASGVVGTDIHLGPYGAFKRLKRLAITECVLSLEEVLQAWATCEGLQHITTEWAFLNCGDEAPSDLYAGLLRHSATLETLHIDMREVRFDESRTAPGQRLGSLKQFTSLTSVSVCETALLGNTIPLTGLPDEVLSPSICELLPASVKRFDFLICSDLSFENSSRLDDALTSWNFVKDCRTGLPELEEVTVRNSDTLRAPRTVEAFEEARVKLSFPTRSGLMHFYDDLQHGY
jgi:hypothetical protein